MSLARLQTEFTAHIRDPDRQAVPDGIEDRRMKIYRELFFNNISSLLASNFPALFVFRVNDCARRGVYFFCHNLSPFSRHRNFFSLQGLA